MTNGKQHEWNQKKIKGIIDFYSVKFFYMKRTLELGAGSSDIGASLLRLGADVTAVDARQEHLKLINKKYPTIKTIKADLDLGWPAPLRKFDLVLNIDLLCHIKDYAEHLRKLCANTFHLVLETAVCDSEDPEKCVMVAENKANFELSFNGMGSRPTAAAIERILTECKMDFRRIDNNKFNSGPYTYDWTSKNNDSCDINNRRIWFAVRNDSPIKFAPPPLPAPINKPTNPNIVNPHAGHIYSTYTDPNAQSAQNAFPIYANNAIIPNSKDSKFVIVIPSYNNINWCEQNISSVLCQDYKNYRIIFTDDCSTDGTFDRVSQIVQNSGKTNIKLIRNNTRRGALANLYEMIHSCKDDEIILTVDGDDWLPDNDVLTRLAGYYSNKSIWMTYGQYKNSTDGFAGVAAPYPDHVVQTNSFRSHTWGASHLRTFYAWLFKRIKREDFNYNGDFMQMAWDMTIMFPMLEMSGVHSKFISDILYVYNLSNPINDHKVNVRLQQTLDRYVRSMPKYNRCEPPIFVKNVGLLLIATGKYDRFIPGIISSGDKFFLNNPKYSVTYYIFSDKDIAVNSSRRIKAINVEHRPFPYASMDRFKHFISNQDKFEDQDYLYYCDVDSLFVSNIGDEIIGDMVGVRHCGFINRSGPFETNPASAAYVEPDKRNIYFGGGFSGGKKDRYLEYAQTCYNLLESDLAKGIKPIWDDESVSTKYFAYNPPNIVLDPSYHYPEGNINYYKKIWGNNNYTPKILLLDKNHSEVR